jgi:hypothetical protein
VTEARRRRQPRQQRQQRQEDTGPKNKPSVGGNGPKGGPEKGGPEDAGEQLLDIREAVDQLVQTMANLDFDLKAIKTKAQGLRKSVVAAHKKVEQDQQRLKRLQAKPKR